MDALLLSRADTAAPALNRGLAVLTALGAVSPQSLEVLAANLKLPKASVFRFLGTLQQIGLVRKTPDKSYEALCVLRPLADVRGQYRERVEKLLPEICRTTGATVEWYEPSSVGMELIGQANPDREVRVQARPGFVRRWGEEFDAVARLGYALATEAPGLSGLHGYLSNGVIEKLPKKRAEELRKEARHQQWASDTPFNANGVRRCAVAALEGGEFRGVLALAEAYHFSAPARADRFVNDLRTALKTLGS
jgi:DNA-binding IclR family transcriptional regulator